MSGVRCGFSRPYSIVTPCLSCPLWPPAKVCIADRPPSSGVRPRSYPQPHWYRNQVYKTEDRRRKLTKTYGLYSHNPHPSFDPVYGTDMSEIKGDWKAQLEILNGFALLDLFFLANILPFELSVLNRFEDAKQFIQTTLKNDQGLSDRIKPLYPDDERYTRNLALKLDI